MTINKAANEQLPLIITTTPPSKDVRVKRGIDSPLEKQAASRASPCAPFSFDDTHERTRGSSPAVSTVLIPQSEAAILICVLILVLVWAARESAFFIYILSTTYSAWQEFVCIYKIFIKNTCISLYLQLFAHQTTRYEGSRRENATK